MSSSVANNVQKLRKQQAVTQELLGEAVGVTRQTVIAIEKGNYAPSITLALKIAAYFRKPVEEVFYLNYE